MTLFSSCNVYIAPTSSYSGYSSYSNYSSYSSYTSTYSSGYSPKSYSIDDRVIVHSIKDYHPSTRTKSKR